jgi:hypothetical protein
MVRIYEVMARIAGICVDGRSSRGAWGSEKQFHASRESAEAAMARLRAGEYFGCPVPPTYEVVERTRDDFPGDNLGEQEWRHACRQAGVDPAEAADS